MSVGWTSAEAALVTVTRTLAVCSCGYLVARFRLKPGSTDSWRDLARINAELLTPCLSVAAFTSGVNPEVLRGLWPVVALSFALPLLWLCLGALGAWLTFSRDQQHFLIFAACTVAYPNAFAIPYPLVLGLRRQVPWLGGEDVSEFAATVCVLFSLFELLQVWSVAYFLYGRAAKLERLGEAGSAEAALEGSAQEHSLGGSVKVEDVHLEGGCLDRELAAIDRELAAVDSEERGGEVEVKVGAARSGSSPTPFRPAPSGVMVATSATTSAAGCVQALREVLNPLMLSLLFALGISVSPLRLPFVNSEAWEVVHFVGSASIPLVLMQMGAAVARPPPVGKEGLQMRSAAIIVVLRLVIGNILGGAVVTACRHMGWIADRRVALCLYIQCAAPTAANLMLVSGVQRAYVQPTAVVLFIMQLVAIPTLALSIGVHVAVLS